jgi:hypothetical protein
MSFIFPPRTSLTDPWMDISRSVGLAVRSLEMILFGFGISFLEGLKDGL